MLIQELRDATLETLSNLFTSVLKSLLLAKTCCIVYGLTSYGIHGVALSRPQVDACVLAFLRNRGNWNTQAHTGRIVVDYAAHSKNIRVSEQLGTLGRQRIHVHVTGDNTQE